MSTSDASKKPPLGAVRSQAALDEARQRAVEFIQKIDHYAMPILRGLLHEWFPAGKLRGHEFHIGSLDGEPGDSMKINIVTGVGKDFAEGQGFRGPVSILAARLRLNRLETAKVLAMSLGIELPAAYKPSRLALDRASGATRLPVRDIVRQARENPLGEDHRAAWQPVIPAPAHAPALIEPGDAWTTQPILNPSKDPADPKSAPKRWKPSRGWAYRDPEGRLLGYVLRLDFEDGKKITPTVIWCRHKETGEERWCVAHFPEPRPMYRLDALAASSPEASVILPEGEKAADAAAEMLRGHFVAASWPGGAKAIAYIDWRPLAGRRVLIARDNDEAGKDATRVIIRAVRAVGGYPMVLDPPPGASDGWDIADAAVEQGWDRRDALRWAALAVEAGKWLAANPEPRKEDHALQGAVAAEIRGPRL